MENFMERLKNWLSGKYEIVNLIVLGFLLLGSCFHVAFIVCVLVWSVAISFNNKDVNQIFGLFIILRLFRYCLVVGNIEVGVIISYYLGLVLIKDLILDIISKKIKFEWKLLLAFLVFLAFAFLLPSQIHANKLANSVSLIFIVIYIFSAYSQRAELEFDRLVKYLAYAIIFSGLFSLLYRLVPGTIYISHDVLFDGQIKISGFLIHSNHYMAYIALACAGLFISKINEKISTPEFIFLFVFVFVLGLYCLSRMYFISVAVSILLFIMFYLFKNRIRGVQFVLNFLAILLVTCLIFSQPFNTTILRFIQSYEGEAVEKLDGLTAEQLALILNGEVAFDPGRLGIWELYAYQITSSPFRLLFGFGLGAPDIGQLHAHNILLYFIYHFGIIGFVIVTFIVLLMISDFKFKNLKHKLLGIILICGYYSVSMLDCNNLSNIPYVLAIALFSQKINSPENKFSEPCKMNYMLLSHDKFEKYMLFQIH